MSFPLFDIGWKIQGMENPGENFSPGPTNFFLPNREENQGKKTGLNVDLLECPPLTLLIQDFHLPL